MALAASGGALLERVAQAVGLDATRLELVTAYAERLQEAAGRRLSSLAALLHRVSPGVRLV